jgi:hypothetical protein
MNVVSPRILRDVTQVTLGREGKPRSPECAEVAQGTSPAVDTARMAYIRRQLVLQALDEYAANVEMTFTPRSFAGWIR